jgi:hypothetical protein
MKSSINDGGPAFPFGQFSETTGQPINGYYNPGLSLRDYFAAKAMQGLIAAPGNITEIDLDAWSRTVAPFAYLAADAMLAERAKTKGGAS